MKYLEILFISTLVLLSSCGPKKKSSVEETISEAKGSIREATRIAKENSSGILALRKMPEDVSQKVSIEQAGPMPSSNYKFLNSMKVEEKESLEKFIKEFRKGNSPTSYVPSCSSYGNPNPADPVLLETDYYTTSTAGVIQVANDLGSTAKIFDYVKNDIENDQIFGATQSADSLLRTRKGSVVDKANLLAALLRAKGTPVQFESGEIYLTEAQAQRFFNEPHLGNVIWTIYQVFGGYFGSTESGFISEFYQIIDGVKYFTIPHIWLRVWDEGVWKNMDPTLVSDQLLPSRGESLLSASYKSDLSTWFFGADSNGDYIKPKTLIDFLLEGAKLNSTIDFINSTDSKTSIVYTDGVISNLSPCRKGVLNKIDNSSLEFRGEIVLRNSAGVGVMWVNQPLARLSEEKSYLSHSAGLLSDFTTPQTGNLEFRIGDQVVSQYSTTAEVGNKFTVEYNTYSPFGYRVKKLSSVANQKYSAGGLLATHFFAREISQIDLEMATDFLRKDIENNASSKILMADSHRLLGLLYHFYYSRSLRDIHSLRGVRVLPNVGFTTLTTQGRIVDVADARDFGFVPTFPIVDVTQLGLLVAVDMGALGNHDSFLQTGNAFEDLLITNSDYEAKIFEDLFGLKAYSSTRALQIAGLSDSINHSTYNYSFFRGIEINAAGISKINSQIDPNSRLFSSWPTIQAMANPGLVLWGTNRNIIDPETGDELHAYFLYGGSVKDTANVTGARFSVVNWGVPSVKKILNTDRPNIFERVFGRGNFKGQVGLQKTQESNGQSSHPLGGGGGDWDGDGDDDFIDFEEGRTWVAGVEPWDTEDTPGSGCDSSSNPVHYPSGLMWHTFTDFNLTGHTPLTGLIFQRTYYTYPQYQKTGGLADVGDLGKGWTHSFDTRLLDGSKDTEGRLLMGPLPNSSADILWIGEGGNPILFKYNSTSGTYSPPNGLNMKLEVVGSTYVLSRKGNVKYYFKKDYSSNFNGRLIKISDPHGEELTLSYDENGRLASVHSPFAGNLLFTRDGQNKLIRVRNDKNNLEVNFGYSNGVLAYSDDFDGNRTSYEYNTSQSGTAAFGLLTSIIDPLKRRISFEYYRNGKVYKEIGLGGAKQVYQYAPYRYQKYTRVDAPNGQTTEFRYDNDFRIVLEIRSDGARIQRNWNSDSQLSWFTDELGNKTEYTYDARGNVTGIKRPLDSAFTSISYDQTFDTPITMIPLIGSPNNFQLNGVGDIISTSRDVAGNLFETKFTYDQFGNRLSTKSNLNSYSDITDADGFLKFKFDSRNPQNIKHDLRGRITEVAFANGRVLRYAYNKFSRVISSDDTHGPSFRNTYDTGGRLVQRQRIVGGAIQTSTYNYDERDRLISEKNFAGETTSYSYDIVGVGCRVQDKVTQITRNDGLTSRFKYDSMGRKIKEIYPDGTILQFGYNLRGNLVSFLDSRGNLIQYEYDENQRVVKTLSQSAGWIQSLEGGDNRLGSLPELVAFSYDAADRLIKKEKFLNDETLLNGKYVNDYKYDSIGRLLQVSTTHQRGGKVIEDFDLVNFKYYPILNPTLISEVTNKNVKLSFTFETQPPFSVTSFSQQPTSFGASLGIEKHQYKVTPIQSGPVGQITRDGVTILNQNYDSAGRPVVIQGSFNGLSNISTISYDRLGRRTSINNSTGSSGTFSYDDIDRITSINWSGSPSLVESISYNKGGLISQVVREIGTFIYGYTDRDEVSSISYSGSEALSNSNVNTSLTYDSGGNILSYRGQVFQNVSNFVSHIDGAQYIPSSDGLGRLVSRGLATSNQTYSYFPDEKLKQVRELSVSGGYSRNISYYYDGLGRRIAKVLSGTAPSGLVQNSKIFYSHLGSENKVLFSKLVQVGSAAKEVLYIDGDQIDDHLFEISNSTGVKIYKKDHLGSIINSAAIGGKSVYGLFGENLGTPVLNDSFSEPLTYGFNGREYDNETGFYYFRARYYSPALAKFITKDPSGIIGGSANLYRFVGNNPISNIDPWGLNDKDINQAIHYVRDYYGDQVSGIVYQIGPLPPGVLGETNGNIVTINAVYGSDGNSRMPPLKDEDAMRLLETVFHESIHTFQDNPEDAVMFWQDTLFGNDAHGEGAIHTDIRREAEDLAKENFADFNAIRNWDKQNRDSELKENSCGKGGGGMVNDGSSGRHGIPGYATGWIFRL